MRIATGNNHNSRTQRQSARRTQKAEWAPLQTEPILSVIAAVKLLAHQTEIAADSRNKIPARLCCKTSCRPRCNITEVRGSTGTYTTARAVAAYAVNRA